jgi:hypothetical protein
VVVGGGDGGIHRLPLGAQTWRSLPGGAARKGSSGVDRPKAVPGSVVAAVAAPPLAFGRATPLGPGALRKLLRSLLRCLLLRRKRRCQVVRQRPLRPPPDAVPVPVIHGHGILLSPVGSRRSDHPAWTTARTGDPGCRPGDRSRKDFKQGGVGREAEGRRMRPGPPPPHLRRYRAGGAEFRIAHGRGG